MMNNYIIPLILSLSIICNTESLILRYIIKTTLVITHNPPPHPTQLLKFRLSPMTVYEMVWFRTLDMESWANFTHIYIIPMLYIYDTTPPHLYPVCFIYLYHVFLLLSLLSIYLVITPLLLYLSFSQLIPNSCFLSIRASPKRCTLVCFKTCRSTIVSLLYIFYNMRLKFSFFQSMKILTVLS